LLLLEICHKILEKDREPHLRNHELFGPYRDLADQYQQDEFVAEGDFAERMLSLVGRIVEDFQGLLHSGEGKRSLKAAQITEILYKHDVGRLRQQVWEYLVLKDGLWVLIDNLDKGWPASGVTGDDLTIIRCLLDAIAKVERSLQHADVDCHGVVLLRNDVYELLVEATPDRGKLSRVSIDWTDPELLRELLRRRFVYSGVEASAPFSAVWAQVCVSHIGGEESSQYLVDRSLMRPRSLIELFNYCRAHAVNLGHKRIEEEDVRDGEERYSTELVQNISFEIRDVFPNLGDVLYEFLEVPVRLDSEQLDTRLAPVCSDHKERERLLELLVWFGFLGFVREDGEVAYIYSVKYDMKRLKAIIAKKRTGRVVYQINPAFWSGLEVHN